MLSASPSASSSAAAAHRQPQWTLPRPPPSWRQRRRCRRGRVGSEVAGHRAVGVRVVREVHDQAGPPARARVVVVAGDPAVVVVSYAVVVVAVTRSPRHDAVVLPIARYTNEHAAGDGVPPPERGRQVDVVVPRRPNAAEPPDDARRRLPRPRPRRPRTAGPCSTTPSIRQSRRSGSRRRTPRTSTA